MRRDITSYTYIHIHEEGGEEGDQPDESLPPGHQVVLPQLRYLNIIAFCCFYIYLTLTRYLAHFQKNKHLNIFN